MKKSRKMLVALILASFGLPAAGDVCADSQQAAVQNQAVSQSVRTEMERLFSNAVLQQKDSYILYDAPSGEFMVLAPEDYQFVSACASVVAKEGAEDEQCLLGRVRTESQAAHLAGTLLGQIPAATPCEVHVEYNEKGYYLFHYRLMD